ncbi:hypothetical protein GQE99_11840 [Maritimibacter sp. DP07]|uniref:Uncharacterized protein n=1 Tax=Maritimibacter harenae TaxID=2606218 RepID=A0A845M7I2_9RHOB|nr:hypothetical protein [Maritimibacter harenae]MZR13707.1 hypothetical protein [Maritimibacter harenae]
MKKSLAFKSTRSLAISTEVGPDIALVKALFDDFLLQLFDVSWELGPARDTYYSSLTR